MNTMMTWPDFAILAVIAVFLLMTRTTLGRAFYAAGGNPHAAVYVHADGGYHLGFGHGPVQTQGHDHDEDHVD